MKVRLAAFAAALCAVTATTAVLAQDPVAEREKMMKEWGQLTKPVGAMLQGKAEFDLPTVQKALDSYIAHSATFPSLFPAGSGAGKTDALPAVWERNDEFRALFAKMGTDATAARAAITDAATFKANFPTVVKNCGTCHDSFRKKS